MAETTKKKRRTRRVREAIREETRAAYREAILEAAAKTFGRLGFHEVKMTDIAAEAGVAAGTLYNYFASKDEIFALMLKRGHEHFVEVVQTAVATESDPEQRLLVFLRTSFSFLEQSGPLFAIYLRQGGLNEWSRQRLRESDNVQARRNLELLAATFAAAQESGQVRDDLPPEELLELFTGLIDAQIFAWVSRGCPPDLVAKAEVIFDVFLNGVRR
jgi:AcrR family transcriptional regulator